MDADRAISRVRRAKGRRDPDSQGIDLGSIAAGLVVPLVAVLIAIAGPMPHWLRFVVVGLGIAIGGGVAGVFTRGRFHLAIIHGVGVVVVTISLLGIVGFTVGIGNGDLDRVLVFSLADRGPGVLILGLMAGIALGAGFAVLGKALRPKIVT